MRIATALLSAGAVLYGLAVAVLGINEIIVQLSSGVTALTLDGPASTNEAGSPYTETIDRVSLFIAGLPLSLQLLHLTGSALGVLIYLSLAASAVLLGRALLRGRPFDRAVAFSIEFAVVSLLGFGLAAQFVDWLGDVAILDHLGDHRFARSFTLDPVVIAGALALALVAIAFRSGTRLQRDTEGLV